MMRLFSTLPTVVLTLVLGFLPAFALTSEELANIKVFKGSSPSVVNITTTTLVRDYFSVYPREGAGSGTIIREEGYVLTNFHVIEGADKIQVALSDGSKYPAELIGTASEHDLAIIRIKSDRSFRPLKFGNSDDIEVGQKVYAIGNPFGLNSTLTTGIISAIGRPLTTESGIVIEKVIQTDTPINPGNSGGPLIDTEGRIIGINTAIFTPSGGSIGIGFAIPINSARMIIPDLITYGKIRKPWLGIVGVPLWEELSDALGLSIKNGILVSEVVKGGPAHKGGIKGGTKSFHISNTVIYVGGDVITEIGGKEVGSMGDIRNALYDKKDGEIIDIKVFRQGRYKIFKVKVKLQT